MPIPRGLRSLSVNTHVPPHQEDDTTVCTLRAELFVAAALYALEQKVEVDRGPTLLFFAGFDHARWNAA